MLERVVGDDNMVDFSGFFERFNEAISSERMSRVAVLSIILAFYWLWFIVTVIAIGGVFGWILFLLGVIVHGYMKYRSRKRSYKLHRELIELSEGGTSLTYDLYFVESYVVVDFGGISLAADCRDRRSMRILIRDLYKLIREVRNTGTVMDYKLESELAADYLIRIGVDPTMAEDRLKKDVAESMNNLYSDGFLSEGMLDEELVLAVQSQCEMNGKDAYDPDAIKRQFVDFESKAVENLHIDDPNILLRRE